MRKGRAWHIWGVKICKYYSRFCCLHIRYDQVRSVGGQEHEVKEIPVLHLQNVFPGNLYIP